MEPHVLLDVCEDSFQGIAGVGNVKFWVFEVDEEVWKISLHAVVGTPNSPMGVVPSSCVFIRRPFFEERSPLVVPEFQPERELCFADIGKMPHERLQILSCFELRSPRHVARDDGCLVEMAHLHRDGKALQQATSAVTDDGFHLPSDGFQCLDSFLVRCNRFVGEKLPEEILRAVRAPPDHDTEESLEVCGIHDDDHFVGCHLLPFNRHPLQLSLHPLRTATVYLCDLCMSLFAVRELLPDFSRVRLPFLTTLLPACAALPNLPTAVCPVLLERR